MMAPDQSRTRMLLQFLLPALLNAVALPAGRRGVRRLRTCAPVACVSMRQMVGRTAPTFEADAVIEQEFISVKLSDYARKRGQYVILLFYPLDFTFVCPTEITAFSDWNDEFRALNAQILAVSVDSKYTHLAWTQTERKNGGVGDVNFPLVSDITKSIAASYDMLIEEEGVAQRGLFIIDPSGIVQHMAVNDLAFGRNPTEVLRILRAIQYTQQHPDELCPAEWNAGERTIPANIAGVMQYFADKEEEGN
ncbi:thioredoxin-like protein [Pavlovales sp. CCMP2436]|nr:thioredoxin-like protein [Pavlovales sp. CCMP2436]|mmetsp:Transcript_33494/g.78760  ORF Transcript_33494/g.78760 Transcript_33494/m.78760 type:complete len:250 (-) Transcript_33494:189-938(-)